MEHLISIAGQLLPGLGILLTIFSLTIVIGIPPGMCICLLADVQNTSLKWLAQIYILLFRGTPPHAAAGVFFIGWPMIFGRAPLWRRGRGDCSIFTELCRLFCGKFSAAVFSPFRAGSMKRLRCWSFHRQCFFKIIVPQVIKRVIPPMGNEFVTLVRTLPSYTP